jgi:hypothetical protein
MKTVSKLFAGIILAGLGSIGIGCWMNYRNTEIIKTIEEKIPKGVLDLESKLEEARGGTLQKTIENILENPQYYQEIIVELNTNYDMNDVKLTRDSLKKYNIEKKLYYLYLIGGAACLISLYGLGMTVLQNKIEKSMERYKKEVLHEKVKISREKFEKKEINGDIGRWTDEGGK